MKYQSTILLVFIGFLLLLDSVTSVTEVETDLL
jgi:hypothetical protein